MAPKKKPVKSDCRNLEEQKNERAIKQILLAAEVNPDYYANFIRRGIDFQAFIEMTAEDLAVIGITKEAEINAILRCTQVLEGTYSKFMDSSAFDISRSLEDTKLAILLTHCDLIKIKRFLLSKELDKMGSSCHMSNPVLEPGQTSSSACLNFLSSINMGLSIAEENYQTVLEALEENKAEKGRSRYWLLFGVASSLFITAILSAFLIKKRLI